MRSVGAYEAKTHLPKLLDDVARGETITITKHGVAVARLVPAPGRRSNDIDAIVTALRRFRAGKRLRGLSVRELVEEGRRY